MAPLIGAFFLAGSESDTYAIQSAAHCGDCRRFLACGLGRVGFGIRCPRYGRRPSDHPRNRFVQCAAGKRNGPALYVQQPVDARDRHRREIRCDPFGRATFDRLSTDKVYDVLAKVGDKLLGWRSIWLDSDDPKQKSDLHVWAPRWATIHIRNGQGKPIAGARVQEIRGDTPNGLCRVEWADLSKFGISAGASDAGGELKIDGLPDGQIHVQLFHAKFAPATSDKIAFGPRAVNNVTMQLGAKVEFRFHFPKGVSQIDNLILTWPDDFVQRNSLLPPVRAGKNVELALPAGMYSFLWLQHADFAITPEYTPRKLFEIRGGDNEFDFDVRPKTKVRGRVLDARTGEPVGELHILSLAESSKVEGPRANLAAPWTSMGSAYTDSRGQYELRLPAGRARICVRCNGMIGQHKFETVTVAADGSTTVPDILLRPVPKIHGVVRDAQGRPVPGAVVRLRDDPVLVDYPVVTDAAGRFELSTEHMYQFDDEKPARTILAFDAYRQLGAMMRIDCSDLRSLEDVDLRLGPQDASFPVSGFPEEMATNAKPAVAEAACGAGRILRGGMPAAELDGALWLNTPKPKMSLADFRGHYVLLHFWATWCGGCVLDWPRLQQLQKLYKPAGLEIICIHDNSTPIADIKAYVADRKIEFPVLIDRRDNRVSDAYKPHGADAYPSEVLIDPDGKIVGHPEAHLVLYRTEILRQHLLSPPPANSDQP